jgi:hypothetical protein
MKWYEKENGCHRFISAVTAMNTFLKVSGDNNRRNELQSNTQEFKIIDLNLIF